MTGIKLIEDFINQRQEDSLVKNLDELFGTKANKGRTVMRFGSSKSYVRGFVSPEIPKFIESVVDMMVFDNITEPPDHVTVNLYIPGAETIPFHVDNRDSGHVIAILSLCSEAVMLLRKTVRKSDKAELVLPKNSLLLLSAEARWDYQHSIAPVKEKRYSLVFRRTI